MSPVNPVERDWVKKDKEILKYGVSLDGVPVKSIVLEASAFPAPVPPNMVSVVEAGTVLMKSPSGKTMVPYDGSGQAKIEGILTSSVSVWVNTTTGNESAAMYYRNVVFATAGIVGFASFAADLIARFPTCGWE